MFINGRPVDLPKVRPGPHDDYLECRSVHSLSELQTLICYGTCLQFGRVLTETYRACSVGRASQNSKPMAVINVQLPPSR